MDRVYRVRVENTMDYNMDTAVLFRIWGLGVYVPHNVVNGHGFP